MEDGKHTQQSCSYSISALKLQNSVVHIEILYLKGVDAKTKRMFEAILSGGNGYSCISNVNINLLFIANSKDNLT